MLNRNIVSKNFRYRSNEFNFRLGFPEEKTVKIGALYTRIDYWKNVYFKFLKLSPFDNIMFYMNQSGFDDNVQHLFFSNRHDSATLFHSPYIERLNLCVGTDCNELNNPLLYVAFLDYIPLVGHS